jgi:hypothetical protein
MPLLRQPQQYFDLAQDSSLFSVFLENLLIWAGISRRSVL